jgi:hypothetical protein
LDCLSVTGPELSGFAIVAAPVRIEFVLSSSCCDVACANTVWIDAARTSAARPAISREGHGGLGACCQTRTTPGPGTKEGEF